MLGSLDQLGGSIDFVGKTEQRWHVVVTNPPEGRHSAEYRCEHIVVLVFDDVGLHDEGKTELLRRSRCRQFFIPSDGISTAEIFVNHDAIAYMALKSLSSCGIGDRKARSLVTVSTRTMTRTVRSSKILSSLHLLVQVLY